jgi:serine/threonine-protein kinase
VANEKESRQTSGIRMHQEGTAKATAESKPGAIATVSIAVAPWGEVYLDGKKQGVSPPLDVLHVTPGEHVIEFRNTTFPPRTLNIQVKAGEQKKIKHKFGN